MPETETISTNPLVEKLIAEKKVARSFVERRYEDWNSNYELFRNKVQTNRLTQRQAVNIPLMKETIKTLLSKIDDPPFIDFKEKTGDDQKDLIITEKWNADFNRCNLEGVDIQDKKIVLLYGRSFKKLNFTDKKFTVNALDIYDVVIDPLTDPLDIETARFIIHQNIFRSVREILADERYTEEGKNELKTYLTTTDAVIQGETNQEQLKKKQDRLVAMGVNASDFDTFGAGDVIVNLTEHYTSLWEDGKFVKYVCVYVNDRVLLLKEKLKDLLGVDFYPFVSWAEDIESQDFWSDSPADLVRTPNKILNVWFSQMIENRTLKNFQMSWYLPSEGYVPQTYEPGPGVQLPAPPGDDIRKVIMPVEVSGLDEAMNQINFLIGLVERGTAATATEKGEVQEEKTTLGEVELAVGKAMERTLTMRKFYNRAWKELAFKWYAILDANTSASNKEKLNKVSASGKMWEKDIYGYDWKSKAGYEITVSSSSEQESEKTKGVQRWIFIKNQFPDNSAVQRIASRRILDIGDLTVDELRQIDEFEKKKEEMSMQPNPAMMQSNPQEEAMMGQIKNQLGQLQNVG